MRVLELYNEYYHRKPYGKCGEGTLQVGSPGNPHHGLNKWDPMWIPCGEIEEHVVSEGIAELVNSKKSLTMLCAEEARLGEPGNATRE